MYYEKDIETDDSGELILENGDLKMATCSRSLTQSTLFVTMTDVGDYGPVPEFGGNLGSFIGKLSGTQTWQDMEKSLRGGLHNQAILSADSYQITVVPVDTDVAFVMLKLQLVTQEDLAANREPESITYGFKFPFMTGDLEAVPSS